MQGLLIKSVPYGHIVFHLAFSQDEYLSISNMCAVCVLHMYIYLFWNLADDFPIKLAIESTK